MSAPNISLVWDGAGRAAPQLSVRQIMMILKISKLSIVILIVLMFMVSNLVAEHKKGTSIPIESIRPQYFPAQESWALIVHYVTKIPLSNETELKNQVEALFQSKVKEIATNYNLNGNINTSNKEKSIIRFVAIKACDKKKPKNGFFNRQCYGFIFKYTEGKWNLVE